LAELTAEGDKNTVSWNNTRLTRTLKLMLYITSILPNKFMSMHYNEDVYHKVMNPDRKRFLSQKLKNRNKVEDYSDFLWSEEEIDYTENRFDVVFE